MKHNRVSKYETRRRQRKYLGKIYRKTQKREEGRFSRWLKKILRIGGGRVVMMSDRDYLITKGGPWLRVTQKYGKHTA